MQAKNQSETSQYVISRQQKDPRWDAFVADNPSGQYEQTSAWAQAKLTEGWYPLRLVLFSGGACCGGGQILYKRLPLFGKVAYLNKGPIFALNTSPEIIERFIHELTRVVRREQILYLLAQPPDTTCHLNTWFQKAGFREDPIAISLAAGTRIDLQAELKEILANMKRTNRQSIQRCEREGLKFREGTREDISLFFRLMLESCSRQGTAPNPASEDFFRVLWDNIESSAGKLKLFFAEHKNTPVSGHFVICFGKYVRTWRLGWSGQWPKIRPAQWMIWETIKWAKNANYHFYDFVGISREPAKDLLQGRSLNNVAKARDFYKIMFGGQIYILPRGCIYCLNPLLTRIYIEFVARAAAGKRLHLPVGRIERFLRK